jgi:SOS response regulatory protein OraA/RecX
MPDGAERAYVVGLTLLARRELGETQLRTRLARRKFDDEDIDGAIARLRHEGALDDRRTAIACARTEVRLRHRGRARVLRQIEALGIARDVARDAVAEVFTELDEAELLEQALDRRLRRGLVLNDPLVLQRMHRYLVAQGFDPSAVSGLLRRRAQMT